MSRYAKILLALALLAIWQAVCSLGLISPVIVASPINIVRAATSEWPEFLGALGYTSLLILAGIVGAWGLGIVVGAALGSSELLARATAPILSSILAVPLVVWYPILMVWVGIGAESKIIYGMLSGFFPIALATLNAVQHYDRRYVTLARAMGANTVQLFVRFIIPMTLPTIVAGLRVGTAFTVIGIIVAEMLASTAGLGFLISYYRTMFDTGHVYLGISLALAITFVINLGLTSLEKHMGRWRSLELSARTSR